MLKRLISFWRARDGLAAIEFAFIAPVLATFFLGAIEITDALSCNQRVTGLASTAADLITQEKQVSNSDVTNVFSAINAIVYPYPTAGVKIVITHLTDNGLGGGKVTWSDAQNSAARVVNSGSKIRARKWLGIPGPSSSTTTVTP